MRRLSVLLLLTCFFFLRSTSVHAAMSVTSSAITPAQVIDTLDNTITVTVASSSGGVAYLRPVFYKAGTTQYFGCATSSTTATYCGTDVTQYPSITGNGSITFTIQADMSSANFKGSGAYQFKVRRCTASGSCTLDSAEQTVQITQTVANPTPSPTQNSTSAPTTSEPTTTPMPTAIPPQPTGIILSEIMACPPAEGKEWIEIMNTNTQAVTIEDWELRDSTASRHVVLPKITISGSGFAVYELTSGMYNNSPGDTVKLVDAAGSIVESFSYTSCASDQSWSKQGTAWTQTSSITKGSTNQFPSANPTATPIGATLVKTTTKPSPSPAATISLTPTAMNASDMQEDDVLGLAIDEVHAGSEEASDSSSWNVNALTPRTKIFALATLGVGGATLVGLGSYLVFQFLKKKRK